MLVFYGSNLKLYSHAYGYEFMEHPLTEWQTEYIRAVRNHLTIIICREIDAGNPHAIAFLKEAIKKAGPKPAKG